MIVVDTSGVLALKDEAHPDHRAAADVVTTHAGEFLLSPFCLAECDYLLAGRLGFAAARTFLDEVTSRAYTLVDFDEGDVATAAGVIDRYRDLEIGVADASLVVIAARYQTTRLLTLDHRHFRTVAPLWGATHFTLLPADR